MLTINGVVLLVPFSFERYRFQSLKLLYGTIFSSVVRMRARTADLWLKEQFKIAL